MFRSTKPSTQCFETNSQPMLPVRTPSKQRVTETVGRSGIINGVEFEHADEGAVDHLARLIEGTWTNDPAADVCKVRVKITPALAKTILARVVKDRQRGLDKNDVARLAEQMREGLFYKSEDPAMLAALDGRNGNGQHRLHAIVQSGIASWMYIAFNVSEETIRVTDRGRRRSNADSAATSDDIYRPYVTVPRIQAVAYVATNNPLSLRWSLAQIKPWYAKLRDSAIWAADNIHRTRALGTMYPSAALIIAHHKLPAQTERFVHCFNECISEPGVGALLRLAVNRSFEWHDRNAALQVLHAVKCLEDGKRVSVLRVSDETLAFFLKGKK